MNAPVNGLRRAPPSGSLTDTLSDLRLGVSLAELRQGGIVDVKQMPKVLGRILRMVAASPFRLALALGATLGATVFNLVMPHLSGHAVDQASIFLQAGTAHRGDAEAALLTTAALIIGAAALRGGLQMIAGYQGEYIGQRVGYDLRLAFFDKLQRLGFEFHDKNHSGDLITRGMLDLEGVRGFIENGLQRIVSLTMLVSVGAIVFFSIDPLMARCRSVLFLSLRGVPSEPAFSSVSHGRASKSGCPF